MKAGMRRIVSLVKGYCVLSCGHLVPARGASHFWHHVGRSFLLCPTCPRKERG